VKSDLGAALHEAAGYELEGTRRHSLVVDGRYVDELALAKLHDAAVV
jgi:RimJ/RimL family protein N-acetyltransferase